MNTHARHFIHGMIFVLGLALIVGGIATQTSGAWIVGLCVAAANFGIWLA